MSISDLLYPWLQYRGCAAHLIATSDAKPLTAMRISSDAEKDMRHDDPFSPSQL
jgi:hypothetical protein